MFETMENKRLNWFIILVALFASLAGVISDAKATESRRYKTAIPSGKDVEPLIYVLTAVSISVEKSCFHHSEPTEGVKKIRDVYVDCSHHKVATQEFTSFSNCEKEIQRLSKFNFVSLSCSLK